MRSSLRIGAGPKHITTIGILWCNTGKTKSWQELIGFGFLVTKRSKKMTEHIKNWAIIALCLHIIAAIWFAASPTRLGYWLATKDVAYDSIWIEYIGDCDCFE
jgi:hypothetical protein